jgi:hypothetical protein
MRTFHQKYRGNNRVTVFCKNRKPKQGWKEILRGLVFLTLIFFLLSGCQITKAPVKVGNDHPTGVNWAKKLGFPDDRIILILHADDLGMCREANLSGIRYLEEGQIQSGAAMPPCPAFEEIIAWARQHPKKDLGLHLTLTSEWQTYRWGPVTPAAEVPGLIDPDGYLWRSVEEVVHHATAEGSGKRGPGADRKNPGPGVYSRPYRHPHGYPLWACLLYEGLSEGGRRIRNSGDGHRHQ